MSEGGRLLGIYVRDILINASKEEPITIKEILNILEEDYEIYVDKTTIQRYINEMKDGMPQYELMGDRYGYYLKNNSGDLNIKYEDRLKDNELITIINSISNLNYINDNDKINILTKLTEQSDNEETKNLILDKYMPKTENFSEIANQISNDMPKILQNHPILITIKNCRLNEEKPYKFYVYNIIQRNGDLLLVGKSDFKVKVFYYLENVVPASKITSYKLLEDESFEKKPIKIKWSMGFNILDKQERKILRKENPDTIILPDEKIFEKIDMECKIVRKNIDAHEQEIFRLKHLCDEVDKEKIEDEEKIIEQIKEDYRLKLKKYRVMLNG